MKEVYGTLNEKVKYDVEVKYNDDCTDYFKAKVVQRLQDQGVLVLEDAFGGITVLQLARMKYFQQTPRRVSIIYVNGEHVLFIGEDILDVDVMEIARKNGKTHEIRYWNNTCGSPQIPESIMSSDSVRVHDGLGFKVVDKKD